jgi:hypothetical protein
MRIEARYALLPLMEKEMLELFSRVESQGSK